MYRPVAVFLVGLVLAAVPSAGAATRVVRIEKDGFHPTTITINLDDTVQWRNRDTIRHQVVSDTGAFASPILRAGANWSFPFSVAGRYPYHDGLEPSEHGVVVVRAPAAAVSLSVAPSMVVYGTDVKLTGSVSNRRTGEQVQILAQPYGNAAPVAVATVATTGGGVFEYVHRPSLLTTYTVHWRNVNSQPAGVQVRPRITFRRTSGRKRLYTHVTAARSFGGHWVYLQKRNRFYQWVSVRKVHLGSRSGRVFDRPRKSGRYRIFMTVNQAGAGYVASWSGILRLR
jgi:plastocyanin